jgi:glucose/arabinose dehydrogenase
MRSPTRLATGPDGSLYVTDDQSGAVDRITP